MPASREEVESLLEKHPSLEEKLEELLALDTANDTWSFDQTPFDSGHFGELVSREIVERSDGEYRLADRQAVEAVLDSGTDQSPTNSTDSAPDSALGSTTGPDLIANVSIERVSPLLVGVLIVILLRTVPITGAVFKNGDIVLAGNDPYLYRFWVEQLLASDISKFELGSLDRAHWEIPTHDVLMVVTMWWGASLLGGTPQAAGLVLATYPVVAAVLVAIGVYMMTIRLTADRRVATAAVLMFAFIPVSAFRMMLGFGDHHAFDYVWLALTAGSLLGLVTAQSEASEGLSLSTPQLGLTVGLGIGVAAQVTAWRGGPLLVLPIGVYAGLQALLNVRDNRPTLQRHPGILLGLAIGSILAIVPHLVWGWLPAHRAFAPLLLFGGTVVTFWVAEYAQREGYDVRTTVVGLVVVGVLGISTLWVLVPAVSSGLSGFVTYMQAYTGSGIAETYSLVSADLGLFFGPVLLFSFILFLSVPPLLRSTIDSIRTNDSGWLTMSVYGWYFFVLSLIQIRFAGQLALFVAVFAGVGFVSLAARLDLANEISAGKGTDEDRMHSRSADQNVSSVVPLRIPEPRTLIYIGVVFMLITSFSVIQIPVKQHQLAVDGETYDTATWIAGNASDSDGVARPNYVFSPWGRNRVYNYFVSGQSYSYGYAKENYSAFIRSQRPVEWYEQLRGRTGYIVTVDTAADFPEKSMQRRLQHNYGSGSDDVDALSHYRAVYVASDGAQKVFTLVPGATVSGTGPANETLTATVTVDIPGETFTYRRTVETGPDGGFQFTTPYPGTYEIGNTSVDVSEAAVLEGEQIKATA